MKKIILFLTAGALFFAGTVNASTLFPTGGGTGSTTLSGILIGNGTAPVNTLIVGTGLNLTGTTLTSTGGGSTFGKTWELNSSGQLTPTTTVPVLISNALTVLNPSTTQGVGSFIGTDATHGFQFGYYNTNNYALWPAGVTPGSTNYSFLLANAGTSAQFNSTNNVEFNISDSVKVAITATGVTLSSLTNGLVKSTSGLLSNATNGTDYTLVTANTCGAGQFFNSATAAGVLGCGTPAGTTYTGTYPISVTGSVISTALSTTTTNIWAQDNTFTNGIILTGTSSPFYSQGRLVYDTDNQSPTFFNNDSSISLQIGQEEWTRVWNSTGSTIANGSPVYINGTHGTLPSIALSDATDPGKIVTLGLATEDIANNATGTITTIGVVHGINTLAFAAGANVYVGTTPGALTTTAPTSPNYRYRVGVVTVSSATVGSIQVTPTTAAVGNGTAGQFLGINASARQAFLGFTYPLLSTGTGVSLAFGTTTSNTWAGTQTFTNSPVFSTLTAGTINSTAGGLIYNTATTSLSVGSPLTVAGTLGALIGGTNSTINCQTASGSQAGCLSSTDWTTFSNKGNGTVTSVTGTWPIVSSGGTTPAISYAGFGTTTNTGIGNNLILYTNASGVVVGTASSTLFGTATPGFVWSYQNGAWGAYATSSSSGGVTGSGANTRVAFWNGASSLTSGADFTFNSGGKLSLGQASGVEQGSLLLFGNNSGSATIQPNTSASGTYTLSLPAVTGNLAALELAQTFTATQTFNGTANSAIFGNNVGISTTTPAANYQVEIASSTGQQLVFSDASKTSNQWAFRNSGGTLYIGTSSPSTYATSSTQSAIQISSNATTLFGIGSTTPTWALSVTGTAGFDSLDAAAGTVQGICIESATKELVINSLASCVTSSKRWKTDIDYSDTPDLQTFMQLKPVTFTRIDSHLKQIGFIAEDIAALDPRLAGYDEQGLPSSIDDTGILAITVKAVQQQQAEIISMGKGIKNNAEDNWQWVAIALLVIWNVYLTLRKK